MSNGQGRGQTILILGIIGLVCCMPCGIVAWVMGSGDMKKIEAGEIPESERGLTQAGMILGMISVGLWIVGMVIWLIMFAVAAGGAAVGGAGM